jgi:hypothetical protein
MAFERGDKKIIKGKFKKAVPILAKARLFSTIAQHFSSMARLFF